MDALKFKMKFLFACLFLTACANNDSGEIDAKAKNDVLANTVLFSVKQQCIPAQILDEEDLPLLTRQGYTLNANNEYCLPPVDNNDGDDTISNCIRDIFIDPEDLTYLISQGYVPNANGEYCLVIGGGSSSGGSTTGSDVGGSTTGSDNGGTVSGGSTTGSDVGGSTTGSDNGGTVSGGSTTGSDVGGSTTGSDNGGTVSGGSTTGSDVGGSTTGSDNGGTVSGGSTTGSDVGGSTTGSDNGGTVSGGSTTGSDVGGSTTGSDNGGTVSGGSVSGGETSGASTTGGESSGGGTVTGGTTSGGETSGGSTSGGSTSGGSTSGGDECKKGNNGHGNDRDHNDSSNPGHSNNGDGTDDDGVPGHKCPPVEEDCEMNLIPGLNNEAYFAKCEPWKVPVDRMCSKMRTGSGRYKLKDRLELVLRVVKKVSSIEEVEECKEERKNFWWSSHKDDDDDHKHKYGSNHKHDRSCQKDNSKIVCKMVKKEVVRMVPICESRDTHKIKRDVMEQRKLDFSGCDISGHNKKDLYVTLYSPVEPTDLPISKYDFDNVRFFKKDSGERGEDELSFILYGSRENRYANIREKIVVIVEDNPDSNKNVNKKDCDQRASPLIVHINPDRDEAKYVKLSSMEDGLEFNILGFNAEPRAHAPKQISWLNSDQYMFLVKPNKKGRVQGVDEMFGDNTKGPDADFAANGFLALAKFDSNGDGLINKKDAVFSKLRLWKDKNFDGVGTPDELFSLERMRVKNIDLRYDASFREQDAHGNETVYKSVIQYNDGSLDLICDLWFNYKK